MTFKPLMMKQVRSAKPNGLKVISTFSGGGGSCLGYRLAGYDVIGASEFIEPARLSYQANMPHTYVDPRDIREVKAEDWLNRFNLDKGELDLFDGSPPCDSFSMSGKREKKWGKEKDYCGETRQRTDDLFEVYIDLMRGLQPKVFVAENVSGLAYGTAKGYFEFILREMRESGYRVASRMLDAQWLGVPQVRKRVIIIGVRNDLKRDPVFPKPFGPVITVQEAIYKDGKPDPKLAQDDAATKLPPSMLNEARRLRPGMTSKKYFNLIRPALNKPSPCILQLAGSWAGVIHPELDRRLTEMEAKRLCSFPDDYKAVPTKKGVRGQFAQNFARYGLAVPPLMMMNISKAIRDGVFDGGRA